MTAELGELARIVEALLFLSPDPVATEDLAEAADCDPDELATALAELDVAYAPGVRGAARSRRAAGSASGPVESSHPPPTSRRRRPRPGAS